MCNSSRLAEGRRDLDGGQVSSPQRLDQLQAILGGDDIDILWQELADKGSCEIPLILGPLKIACAQPPRRWNFGTCARLLGRSLDLPRGRLDSHTACATFGTPNVMRHDCWLPGLTKTMFWFGGRAISTRAAQYEGVSQDRHEEGVFFRVGDTCSFRSAS